MRNQQEEGPIGCIRTPLIITKSSTRSCSVCIISMKSGSSTIARQHRKLPVIPGETVEKEATCSIAGATHEYIAQERSMIKSCSANMMLAGLTLVALEKGISWYSTMGMGD